MAGSPISITVVLEGESGLLACLQVEQAHTAQGVKALLEADWSVPRAQIELQFGQRVLRDHDRLDAVGIRSDDLLQARILQAAPAPASVPAGGMTMEQQADMLRNQIRSDPTALQDLRRRHPEAADAVQNDDPTVFQNFLREQQRLEIEQRMQEAQRIAAIHADPFNEEHQRAIEEEIRRNNVQNNFNAALEHNPEAFAQICMLYVNLKVNNKPVVAFVDSGAQATIMSLPCAERCGIAHLIDTRYSGIAKGVGTAKICGRIHYVEVMLGTHYIAATLTILERSDIEFLWGLDMLRKHQMCIDLEKNCLRFGSEEVRFLSPQELPSWATPEAVEEAKAAESPIASSSSGQSSTPSQSTAPVASVPTPAPGPAPAASNEGDITTLTGLGFSRQDAVRALAACGGNVELAAGLLFNQ
ncbi:DNA damage-inducible protein 1 [Plasmodiophora brassicae]